MPAPVTSPATPLTAVHLVTLGCARNEVDSEELAARLEDGGFRLVDDPEDADAVMVNTCGFVEAAKKDSVDTLLQAADLKALRPARRPSWPSAAWPSATAPSWPSRCPRPTRCSASTTTPTSRAGSSTSWPAGSTRPTSRATGAPCCRSPRRSVGPPRAPPPSPACRRQTSPVTPLPDGLAPASGPRAYRRRLNGSPYAPLKIASGCDRRCAFCAIPAFRGAYVSRTPAEVVAEARWLVEQGVREVMLVSENTSSYGKDLGDIRLLEKLLVDLGAVDGLERVRVSYLQPAEMRPGLVEAMTSLPHVAPYFDLSFQHAAPERAAPDAPVR